MSVRHIKGELRKSGESDGGMFVRKVSEADPEILASIAEGRSRGDIEAQQSLVRQWATNVLRGRTSVASSGFQRTVDRLSSLVFNPKRWEIASIRRRELDRKTAFQKMIDDFKKECLKEIEYLFSIIELEKDPRDEKEPTE